MTATKRVPRWLVPLRWETWLGKTGKRTVPVFSHVNEWQAQRIAMHSLDDFRNKNRCHWPPIMLHIQHLFVDHAISYAKMACNWGCCSFRQEA